MENNIKSLRKKFGLNVTQLAQKLEMSQANLTKIENNQVELKPQTAQKIASVLGIAPEALYAKPAHQNNEQIPLRLINPEAWSLPSLSELSLPQAIGVSLTENMAGYIAEDDAMSPTILKNALVFVNTSVTTPQKDGIYLINIENYTCLRRLQRAANGMFHIIPDNKSYIPQTLLETKITILAQATASLTVSNL